MNKQTASNSYYDYPQHIKDKFNCFKSKNGEKVTIKEEALSETVKRVVELGILNVNPEKVMLFGSRVNKKATISSDFDIAFIFESKYKDNWVDFVLTVEEAPLAIVDLDLIDYNNSSRDLQESVLRSNIILYERKK